MEMGSVANQLLKKLMEYTTSLFNEGILNAQFTQLQSLQDESNPNFVVEVVTLFFQDSKRILNEVAVTLGQENVDFKKLDANVHQLKGSSSSIGAERVQNACISFRHYCDEKDIEGCSKCLQQMKNEYIQVKNKLETLFKMEQQILAAGGSIPNVIGGY